MKNTHCMQMYYVGTRYSVTKKTTYILSSLLLSSTAVYTNLVLSSMSNQKKELNLDLQPYFQVDLEYLGTKINLKLVL